MSKFYNISCENDIIVLSNGVNTYRFTSFFNRNETMVFTGDNGSMNISIDRILGYATVDDLKNYLSACASGEDSQEPNKTFIGFDTWYSRDDKKFLNPITVKICEVDGNPVVYLIDDENNENPITNLNNYVMSSRRLGSVPVLKSELQTKKGRALDVCGGDNGRTVTLADLQTITDAEIASLTALIPPEDGYEWALLGIEVNQHPSVKTLHCDLSNTKMTIKSSVQAEYAFDGDGGQQITVGDSPDSIVKMLPKADECGCLADRSVLATDADFTTPLTLAEKTAVEICPVYVCVVEA